MIRATTPVHYFRLSADYDPNEFAEILISYSQGDKIVLEKKKEDMQFKPDTDGYPKGWFVYFRLSQEETKLFDAGVGAKPIWVQMRVLTQDGEALACGKIRVHPSDVINDEVLV